jgi:hypothetical protein
MRSADGHSADLWVDGQHRHGGSAAPILDLLEHDTLVQERYLREGNPAWDALMGEAERLGLPVSYAADVKCIDLEWTFGRTTFLWGIGPLGTHLIFPEDVNADWPATERIAYYAKNYPELRWYVYAYSLLAPYETGRTALHYFLDVLGVL